MQENSTKKNDDWLLLSNEALHPKLIAINATQCLKYDYIYLGRK